jgi:hypothetical protein
MSRCGACRDGTTGGSTGRDRRIGRARQADRRGATDRSTRRDHTAERRSCIESRSVGTRRIGRFTLVAGRRGWSFTAAWASAALRACSLWPASASHRSDRGKRTDGSSKSRVCSVTAVGRAGPEWTGRMAPSRFGKRDDATAVSFASHLGGARNAAGRQRALTRPAFPSQLAHHVSSVTPRTLSGLER